MNAGQRCVLSGRDLSGLRFGRLGGGPVDLNGADFAQADLSGTEADDILVHHCSFNGATFDGCHWRRPVFAFADMRRASAKRVIWGTPGPRDPSDPLVPISVTPFYVTPTSQKREYAAISMVQNYWRIPCSGRFVPQQFFGSQALRNELLRCAIDRSKIASLRHIVS